jgi:cellulose synthase/poly-beta-1,6-N-acetylglucosamine synthase-like glycosyltransferase
MITTTLFALCAAASAPGTLTLAVLTAAAAAKRSARGPQKGPKATVDVAQVRIVIPAHDESAGIGAMLDALLAKLPRGATPRQVLVVADHCSDDTAAIARSRGVRVIERHLEARRGKGHALDEAFKQLLEHDADAQYFLVLDADARLGPSALEHLLAKFAEGADVVQASYRVANPDADERAALLHLAWLCFNHLRPLGREHLGLSAGILGNGFGLTRATLEAVPYSAGSIVEDLEYHLRLVKSGRRVRFVSAARVTANAAPTQAAADTQRARWEGGRLRMALEHLPGLAFDVLRGKWRLAEPAFELALLPLGFHALLLCLGVLAGGWWTALAMFGGAVVMSHVLLAVHLAGRGMHDLVALRHAPLYVLKKLKLAPAIARASSKFASWKRTERAA